MGKPGKVWVNFDNRFWIIMAVQVTRFLGSVRLAVPLLIAIAAILIGATFYESSVGSRAVQQLVYKSPWFGALMFLLAVNLGLSTLSRYPWRGARKIGFALTHWGLIVIIAGSAAVIHLSTEGMLLVRMDSGPSNQIRVEGDLLEVVAPDQSPQQTDVWIGPDGLVNPTRFAGLRLLDYSNQTIKTVRFEEGTGVDNPAVKLRLTSDRMGQSLDRWLALAPAMYRQANIGPAQLEIIQAQSPEDLDRLLSPPAQTPAWGTLQVNGTTIDVQQQLGETLVLANDLELTLTQFWSDFRLDANNQPISASNQMRNPAVQINLAQGNVQERWFVFGQNDFEPVRSGDAIRLTVSYIPPSQTAANYFRVVVSPSYQLFYAARSSQGFTSGELQPGVAVTPGWADFKISLVETLRQAQVQRQVVPVTPVNGAVTADQGNPALHVVTPDGQDQWLPWGEPTTLQTKDGPYLAAFSPKLLQLPFWVKLDDFIVERNEGSESVAMWTSQITLIDPEAETAIQRSVWMNHPTWFKGWKLAQASWNPGDLQQSTLQLKREPWWVTALTWIGSLLVVSGIALMFYGPAVTKRFGHPKVSNPQPESVVSSPAPTPDLAPAAVTK
jgi:hypothetical protein